MKSILVASIAVLTYFIAERFAISGLAKAAIVGSAAALTYTLWSLVARRVRQAQTLGRPGSR